MIGRSGRINTIYKVEKSKEDISGGWKDLSKSKVAEEFSGGVVVAVALGNRMVRITAFFGYFFRLG